MKETTNYKLKKIELTDSPPDITVHSGNFDVIDTELAKKVDKVTGKGLSTNDYTAAEKNKLSGIAAGAQVNTVTSVAGKTGAVTVSKSDVRLSNVDNTSDANKPVSSATRAALNNKVDKVTGKGLSTNDYDTVARTKVDAIPVSPKYTDTTYNEISKAEIDAGTSSTLRGISGRRIKYILDKVQGWVSSLTKSDVGLGNVDNVKQATKTEFDTHKGQITSKLVVNTADISLASTLFFTLPFRAKSLLCVAFIQETSNYSIGMWAEDGGDLGTHRNMAIRATDSVAVGGTGLFNFLPSGSSSVACHVSKVTDSGVTLSWSKVGSPTGTATIYILASTH